MKEQRSNHGYNAKWLAALFVGLLFGALAMFLFAPRAGKESRGLMQKRGAKLRHEAEDTLDDVVGEVGDHAHKYSDNFQKGVGGLQRHAQDLVDEMKK